MKFASMDGYNEQKRSQVFFILIAMVSAFVVGNLVLFGLDLLIKIVKFLIAHWIWLAGGILALLFLRRLIGRKKK